MLFAIAAAGCRCHITLICRYIAIRQPHAILRRHAAAMPYCYATSIVAAIIICHYMPALLIIAASAMP